MKRVATHSPDSQGRQIPSELGFRPVLAIFKHINYAHRYRPVRSTESFRCSLAAHGDPARGVHLGCSTRELVTPPNRASPQQRRTFRVSSSTPTDRFHERVGRERIRGGPWLARGEHQGKFLKQAFCPSVQIDTRIATSAHLSVSPRGTSLSHQSPCVNNVPA